ncbi:MAG: glycosyltransferase family 2 protein [Acidobacteriota bacterium]
MSEREFERVSSVLGEDTCRALGLVSVPDGFVLSVVIPVFNEVQTIETVIRAVQDVPIRTEVVVVDDFSTDGTRELLREKAGEWQIQLFEHLENRGKGAALQTGFVQATGSAVIVQDADLEYDPFDYLRLIQPILDGRADVVYGSRFIGETHRVLYFWHSVGNRFLTLLSNAFTNLNLTDMETCYKLFRREVIQQIAPQLRENRFGIEPEITARVAALPEARIYEMPISYNGRTYREGKKIGWRDGVSAIRCILRYAYFR